MERKKTGIKGVDQMIQGGLPDGSIISLKGPPGVGKSIFTLHFLLEGARNGEKCVYINIEEPRRNIDNAINQFEFAKEFFELEKKGLIVIKCLEYPEYERVHIDLFRRILDKTEIKRLAVDSFNCFFAGTQNLNYVNMQSSINIRKMIMTTFSVLRQRNLTTLLIMEESNDLFNFNVPYMVDGIISLDFISLGSLERRIFIPKMRWTKQYDSTKPYEITNNGISIIEED